MTTAQRLDRKPWIASSLSLLCTGLGQIYCGRVGRGLIMNSVSLLFGPVIVGTAVLANSTGLLLAFLCSLVALVGFVTWSVRDAARIARQTKDYEPREFNSPVVYGMLAFTSVLFAVGLAFVLRAMVIEAFVIPSASMAPTLVSGDRILVTKAGMASQTLKRGEVIVFRNPVNRRQTFVKRIIGLPGETVEIRDGQVYVNHQVLPQTRNQDATSGAEGVQIIEQAGELSYRIQVDHPETPLQLPPQTVAPDAYFVLGDHRDQSVDSREIGNVPHGLVVGIVKYIYYPGDTWQRFGIAR